MAPLDKEAKYDRQLRLWAANGQAALESTRLALVTGNAVGTETLKNLILPGVGSYTIIDDAEITPIDTGVNFFLDVDCIGQSRAAKVCEYLQELNPDVSGNFKQASLAQILRDEPSYFTDNFDIVLATNTDPESLVVLSEKLWQANIPLIVVDSIGFMGILRLALPEHCIVETHPDAIVDLRLDRPWPELSALASQLDMESMNDNQHTHIPYVILLLHYMRIWKAEHNNEPPKTYEEKNQFKSMIRKGMRNADEDNFDEAVNNVWRACSTTTIPSDVQRLLAHPSAHNLTNKSPDFWFLVRALDDYVNHEGAGSLPLAGTVPDMKSDTAGFIQLQKTYRAQAMIDISWIKLYLIKHLKQAGRESNGITDQTIESFCKHAAYIKVIHYRSIAEEYAAPKVSLATRVEEDSLAAWYFAKRAAEEFELQHKHFPGAYKESEQEAEEVYQTALRLANCTQHAFLKKTCLELTRCGGGELHCISSLMGGIAAQEIIKIITRQYVPINNTVVFDGIKSATEVFEM